jgi:DHA2 family multidrug resistance protein
VILGAFVSVMDLSIVNVAMPQMLGTFGVTLETVTWVAVAYSIAEVLLITMAAWFTWRRGSARCWAASGSISSLLPFSQYLPCCAGWLARSR